jgi:hypothetical protein
MPFVGLTEMAIETLLEEILINSITYSIEKRFLYNSGVENYFSMIYGKRAVSITTQKPKHLCQLAPSYSMSQFKYD